MNYDLPTSAALYMSLENNYARKCKYFRYSVSKVRRTETKSRKKYNGRRTSLRDPIPTTCCPCNSLLFYVRSTRVHTLFAVRYGVKLSRCSSCTGLLWLWGATFENSGGIFCFCVSVRYSVLRNPIHTPTGINNHTSHSTVLPRTHGHLVHQESSVDSNC